MSVFTDHVSLTPFLLIVAAAAVAMGLSYLRSILVVLGEIKLAMEPQPRGMVKPQNDWANLAPVGRRWAERCRTPCPKLTEYLQTLVGGIGIEPMTCCV